MLSKFAPLLAALLAACGGSDPDSGQADAAGSYRVAVIPKGTAHEFWKSIHAGAVRAQREVGGVEVIWRGAEREDDRDQQVSLVQSFISQKVDAIVLAPLDHRALLAPVKLATQVGIPVVIIDSGLDGEVGKDYASYIATDNFHGGELAGEHMVELLGGKGRVLMLRYVEGSESTRQREEGFAAALAKHADVELVDPKRYAGASRAAAQEASENLLSVHADSIDGVFCSNESATFGMLLALRGRDLIGKRKFVGFDSSTGLTEALEAAEIDALVLQDPLAMGEIGVKTALAILSGEEVETRIDTGVVVATPGNKDEPRVNELLYLDPDSILNAD